MRPTLVGPLEDAMAPPRADTAVPEASDVTPPEDARANGSTRSGRPDLVGAIHRVMDQRGLTTRQVVTRVSQRHIGTFYRLLAGRTTDPWTSTVLTVCEALETDPDELLGVRPPDLEPALAQLFEEAQSLSEHNRWLVVELIRTIRKRAVGPGSSSPTT